MRRTWLEIGCYYLLALAITSATVAPLILAGPAGDQSLHLLGAVGPAIAAGLAALLFGGRQALGRLTGLLVRWPGWRGLLVAGATPLLLLLVAVVAARLVEGQWPAVPFLAAAGLAVLAPSLAYGVLEEVGWRGFALPRLQQLLSPFVATALLTVVWLAWHAPFFFYRYQMDAVGIATFGLSLWAGTIWLTFLFNRTGSSVPATALWHTVWNIVAILALQTDPLVIAVASSMVFGLALLALVLGGWRLGLPGGSPTPPQVAAAAGVQRSPVR